MRATDRSDDVDRSMRALQQEGRKLLLAGDDVGADTVFKQLIAGATAGSQEALECVASLLDEFSVPQRVLRSVLISPEDVADATQTTLFQVGRKLDSFDGRSRFTTWVGSIAKNEALMLLRRRSSRPQLADHDVPEEQRSTAAPLSSYVVLREMLDEAIEQVPEPFRTPLVRRDIEQQDYSAIADELDITVGTARTRVLRGRTEAARILEAYGSRLG